MRGWVVCEGVVVCEGGGGGGVPPLVPALQVQAPSTGEQAAPFLQLQAEEQFPPYVPAGQGAEQSGPCVNEQTNEQTDEHRNV